jgi:hypothetical protein
LRWNDAAIMLQSQHKSSSGPDFLLPPWVISVRSIDYYQYLDYYLVTDSPRWPCLVRILNGLSRQTHYSTEGLANHDTHANLGWTARLGTQRPRKPAERGAAHDLSVDRQTTGSKLPPPIVCSVTSDSFESLKMPSRTQESKARHLLKQDIHPYYKSRWASGSNPCASSRIERERGSLSSAGQV